jgi:phosphotriesterase-related protein
VNPALRIDDFEKTVEELRMYKELGGQSIVDAQPVGCGRMAEYLAESSRKTGVNIIASTGFHKLIFYAEDHWIKCLDEDELADIFIHELEKGMFVDGDYKVPEKAVLSKAGVIKTASDGEGITPEYKKLFKAAARASKSTGFSILSHTEMGKHALEQIELFAKEGVNPDCVIICHLDRDLSDTEYHRAVAETGVFMEYDTIGRFKYHSDMEEAKFIAKMVELGFEDRILLGLDTTRDRLKSYGGKIGLGYIKQEFIPLLLEVGITEGIIEKFTIKNPSEALAKRSETV